MRPPTPPRHPRREPEAAPPDPRAADGAGAPALEQGATAAGEPSSAPGAGLPVRAPHAEPAGARAGFLERLGERTRAQRRLAWRRVLLVLSVLVVVGATAWVLFLSPLLALDMADVTVSGVGEGTTVPREDVVALVEEWAGTPLPRLGTGALTEEITAITTVRSAEVARSWPNGLAVDVVARVPVAATTSDGDLVLLDADGVVVGSVDEVPEGMPRVTLPLSERAAETLAAVLTVLAELPEDLRAEVATAGASNPASISLELADGAQVRWGAVEESALKAEVLAVLREREASVYDVTVPRTPTISR